MNNRNLTGFACMVLDHDREVLEGTKMRTTTVKHFSTLTKKERQNRIGELAFNNLQSLFNQVNWLCKQPEHLRFMRITSDLFPLYTHELAADLYKDLTRSLEFTLVKIGKKARDNNILLTAHPDQFVIMNSPNADLTARSVNEMLYHFSVFQMMGLSFKDGSVLNLHGGGKDNGLEQFIINSKLLPEECRQMISVENDENSFGIDDILNSSIPENFKIVLDIHHHWIKEGNYIYADDDRMKLIVNSWCGKTPKIHVSESPEDLTKSLAVNDRGLHVAPEHKRNVLRKHSDFIWSKQFRQYANTFLKHGNLMVEAKMKNLAAHQLSEELL